VVLGGHPSVAPVELLTVVISLGAVVDPLGE